MNSKLIRFLVTAAATPGFLWLAVNDNLAWLVLLIAGGMLMEPWEYPAEQQRRRTEFARLIPKQRFRR